MASHIVKVLQSFYVTHDVKCFMVEKPENYDFIPGQATDVSINIPGWEEKVRPFTFTNLREQNCLEFIIKIYRDHEGVTNMLGHLNAGTELIIHDVFGAIQFKEPGIFIAAGSGITPFLSIFRDLYKQNKLRGNKLIYTNKTSDDVIMDVELRKMLKNDYLNVFTRENVVGYVGKRIDRNFLIDTVSNFSQHFYVCGPNDFVQNITKILLDLGATSDTLVVEG
ncbi:MAG: FAD-binding oxidoreductase [Flavobacterium sp.]